MKSVLLERLLIGILLVIAGGIVIHAPLTVWIGTIWPDQMLLIKSWKELLMGVALVLCLLFAYERRLMGRFLNDKLIQIALIYAGLHFATLALFHNSAAAIGAGLLIDLRYVLYFVLVYITLQLFPGYRKLFIITFASGAAVVIGFALLQIFVLPKDILAVIGYSKATIAPYLTVDENPAFIRINSTLRGPNPLGAYVVIVVSLLMAVGLKWKLTKNWQWAVGAIAIAAGMVISASHSRSSFIGLIIALLTIIVVSTTKKIRNYIFIAAGLGVLVVGILLFAFRTQPLVANLVFHDNPATGATIDSNTGHAESLIDGSKRMLTQPLGAGIGSTGSASLLGDQPMIIENQYLLIAHEVGWIGLALYVWLYVEIMRRLWQRRAGVLALGLFGAGAGLAIIGLLLPVWTDDTISIVWWGLAAIAVASPILQSERTQKKVRLKNGKRKSN